MKAEEIKDEKSLRAWLEGRPDADLLVIAHRAALRVFSLYVLRSKDWWARKYRVSAVPVLRGHLVAAAAALLQNPSIKGDPDVLAESEDTHAAAAASNAAEAAEIGGSKAAFFAGYAIYGAAADPAANVAVMAADLSALAASAEVEEEDGDTAAAVLAASELWAEVAADAALIASGSSPLEAQLWSGVVPKAIADADRGALSLLSADPPERWDFWRRWWEGAKAGRYLDPQLQLAIVQGVSNETWDAGPDAVAARIREIEEQFGRDPESSRRGTSTPKPDRTSGKSDASNSLSSQRLHSAARNTRVQVSALKDFLETEIEFLRGQNHHEPSEGNGKEDLIEVLRDLQQVVETLLKTLNDEPDPGTALIVAESALPSIVDKAGVLALLQEPPQVSDTVTLMAATIKTLTDAGAPGDMATKIAMGELGLKKLDEGLFQRLRNVLRDWRKKDAD